MKIEDFFIIQEKNFTINGHISENKEKFLYKHVKCVLCKEILTIPSDIGPMFVTKYNTGHNTQAGLNIMKNHLELHQYITK